MAEPEENHSASRARWGWAIVVAIALSLVAWGLAHYAFVRDPPRAWDFGTLDDTPGRSVYSTTEPSAGQPPPEQIPRLPEARKKPPAAPERKGGTP